MLRIFTMLVVICSANRHLALQYAEGSEHHLTPFKSLFQDLKKEKAKSLMDTEIQVKTEVPFGQRVKECRPNFCCPIITTCCSKYFCCGDDMGQKWEIMGWWCQFPKKE